MEALTCQGFPVLARMSNQVPCCSFAARNAGLRTTSHPSRCALIGQSGNSMHTEVSASVLTFALLEIQIDKYARCLFNSGCRRSEPLRPLPQDETEPEDIH